MTFKTITKLVEFDRKYRNIFRDVGCLTMTINAVKKFEGNTIFGWLLTYPAQLNTADEQWLEAIAGCVDALSSMIEANSQNIQILREQCEALIIPMLILVGLHNRICRDSFTFQLQGYRCCECFIIWLKTVTNKLTGIIVVSDMSLLITTLAIWHCWLRWLKQPRNLILNCVVIFLVGFVECYYDTHVSWLSFVNMVGLYALCPC